MTAKNLKIFLLGVILFLSLFLSLEAKADTIGQRKDFFVEPSYDIESRTKVSAILIQIADKVYFYVDEKWWNFSNQQETKIAIENLGSEFSRKIYPVLTSNFGTEWNPGIDKDSRITILIHPMLKDAGGYVRSIDEYYAVQAPSSNEREMIYLNADYIADSYVKSLLAHDFVHLITFNQKEKKYGVEEDVWLNEARAEYGPTLVGYDDNDEKSNLQRRIALFLEKPSDSLTDWQNTKYDYAAANVFVQYLVDHYGKNILIDSLNSSKTGIDSINYALAKNNFKEDFSQIFQDWLVAVFLNDCQVGIKYCYINFNLKNLHIVPQTNFLPFSGDSTLTFSDNLKNWSGNWYKIIGGRQTLNIKFEGSSSAFSKIPYILRKKDGSYSVDFLVVDNINKAEVKIKNFGSEITSFIIIPSVYSKNLKGGLYHSFFWSASISQNGGEQETINKLLSQIEFLKNEIARIQAQIASLSNPKKSFCQKINSNLYFGMENLEEVKCLQEFLKAQGPEIYPEAMVTGYFGGLTKAAVIRFQEKYGKDILEPAGLKNGTGVVAFYTKTKINQMLITNPLTLSFYFGMM